MKIIEEIEELQEFLGNLRKNNERIGLIPTMGSIHKGHLSLVNMSKKMNCISVVTIFVNPTQFNDHEDFINYPTNKKNDISILISKKNDALYFPKSIDLYPNGLERKKTVFDFRNILCDKLRPGHFDGVTTVVNNLFSLIKPDIAFFGEKDFQQLKLIEKLISNNNLPIKIHACPSIRMKNGMSYSSRYKKFSSFQKKIFEIIANKIMHTVNLLKEKIDLNLINSLSKDILKLDSIKIEYIEIREERNLSIVNNNYNSRLFIAIRIDDIRIVDNFLLY
tara:strand:+ start:11566 stop:12399 length:834 start_codon:yes stop_codon:yes gene_type:complete